jgi:hypothetical protein
MYADNLDSDPARNADLEQQVGRLSAELAEARRTVTMLTAELGAAKNRVVQLTAQLEDTKLDATVALAALREHRQRVRELAHHRADQIVPNALRCALRARVDKPQAVPVEARSQRLTLLVEGGQRDPVLELELWEWIETHTRRPDQDLTRLPMPDRLLGMAYPGGAVVLSRALVGDQVAAAWRALRPHRRAAGPSPLARLEALP